MQFQINKTGFIVMLGSWLICMLTVQMTFGDNIAFEWLPGMNSNTPSTHGVGGPVLADDFIPYISGMVSRVEWWGTATVDPMWEITFHDDAPGVPFAQNPLGGISQHSGMVATVTGPDVNGVYGYSVAWEPQDVFINAGTEYWFSVANAEPNWDWALPTGGPTVGSQFYHAARSIGVGPNGGPHFGPWDQFCEPNYAFRILTVPEPSTLVLLGGCVISLLAYVWRRRNH